MGVVLMMPPMMMVVPVNRRYRFHPQLSEAYRHHLLQLQQQEMDHFIRRERNQMEMRMMKFTWTFPGSDDILKLNTDGSSKGNPGLSSFGGLIRDNRGRWVCGYMGKMKGRERTSLEAEAWSVYKGLCLIKEKKLPCVFIETDCVAIMTHGIGKGKGDDGVESVFRAIETMTTELGCTLIHTRRDGNHCADQLAKLGGTQSEEYVELEEPPTGLIPYLARDIEAASEFQRINCRH